jgi:hypothetical protein
MRKPEPKKRMNGRIRCDASQMQRRSVAEILRKSYERFTGDKETRIAVNAILK